MIDQFPAPGNPDDELYQPFFAGMKDRRLQVRRCTACHTWQWPPRPFCRSCQASTFQWENVAETGVIYSYTVMHRAFSEFYADKVPYGVVVVDLGPIRLPGRYLGDPNGILCGNMVEAFFDDQALAGSSLAWASTNAVDA